MKPLFRYAPTVLVALCACDRTHFLSGQYSSDVIGGFDAQFEAETVEAVEALSQMQVELVIGHYGNEVAGLVKFRGVGHERCGCFKLEDGKFDSSTGVVSFYFKTPEKCSSSAQECEQLCRIKLVSANLSKKDNGLEGTCIIVFDGITLQKRLKLKKVAELKELPKEDLGCEGYYIQYPGQQ